jgi:GTP pyrophosphokinase
MVGARVNGKIVNIDYKIQNGDRIEVITSQNSKGPSRDWLNIVKSSQAKNKINQWFKSEFKEDNIVKGKELIEKYCKAKGVVLGELTKPEYIQKVLAKYNLKEWNAVLAAIGHGSLKEGQVINRLVEELDKKRKKVLTDEQVLDEIVENAKIRKPSEASKGGIIVKGTHDVSVRYSKCCNPMPGDEIVGFVTRGRGISIHRTDCVNIICLPEIERARIIEAEWQEERVNGEKYLAEIQIFCQNRTGLLADISKILTEKNIDVETMNSRTNKQGIATITMGFMIGGRDELTKLIDKIRMIDSVIDIVRSSS